MVFGLIVVSNGCRALFGSFRVLLDFYDSSFCFDVDVAFSLSRYLPALRAQLSVFPCQ